MNTTCSACPFCGHTTIRIDTTDQSGATQFYAFCLGCACEGPWANSLGSAVRLWNQRVDDSGKVTRKSA